MLVTPMTYLRTSREVRHFLGPGADRIWDGGGGSAPPDILDGRTAEEATCVFCKHFIYFSKIENSETQIF